MGALAEASRLSPVSSPVTEKPSFAYAPGDVIAGKYTLEELLGTGGMGSVFRARNSAIDMQVALKLIRTDLDRALLSSRLLQEARAAAKLSHSAIVRVFDVGQTDAGDPFIVMELLHGETLAAIIDRDGRVESTRAVQLLLPIADALSVAHGKGFVHRDVKPDNVFISTDAEGQLQPKLVDFGIVKEEHASVDTQLTQVGAVMGSPDYMSPEQARGLDSIDQRSDVWSFSVVLYEAITGAVPFESKNYNALLRMIVENEPVALRDLSAADGELSAIVSKGMSKEPGARWASMGQMGRALASWLFDQGIVDDACGVSLETRWLSRTDSAAPGRVTRSSSPDSWPEPPSGVRAIGRNPATSAPTLELDKNAGTPISLASTSSGVEPRRARLRMYVIAAVVGALVIVALAWAGRSNPTAESRPPLSQSASVASGVQPERTTLAAAAPVATPETTADAAEPKPSAAPAMAKAVPAKPVGRAPQRRRPAAASGAKPASDLLAPY
jgi:serine/threonine-protein kinase